MGLSRTVSEINGDLRRKFQNFPTPCTLCPADGVPLGVGIRYRRRGPKIRIIIIYNILYIIYTL